MPEIVSSFFYYYFRPFCVVFFPPVVSIRREALISELHIQSLEKLLTCILIKIFLNHIYKNVYGDDGSLYMSVLRMRGKKKRY